MSTEIPKLEYADGAIWYLGTDLAMCDIAYPEFGWVFAASPDLLEALKGMLALYRPGPGEEIPSDWPAKARAAIAKAEGRIQ